MTETRKLRVFICHSSQDKPIVRELYQRLNAEGWIDPWLDEEKLLPGQDWDMEIEKAVEVTDTVIVCLSNNSLTKEGYVQRELRFVLNIADYKPDGTIYIIPLRLDNCLIPRRLRGWQYVDYFPDSLKNKTYKRIIESLNSRKPQTEFLDINYKRLNREKLSQRRAKAIELIEEKGNVDVRTVAKELGITGAKTYRLLESLINKGIVSCKYDAQAVGHYSLVKENNQKKSSHTKLSGRSNNDNERVESNGLVKYEGGKIIVESVDVLMAVQAALARLQISDKINVDNKLEKEIKSTKVRATEQLSDVFYCLIANAIEAMPSGGVLQLFSKSGVDNLINIIIEDTGVSPHLDLVFDSSFTESNHGTYSLGLFWSKAFVESFGGKISFEGHEGEIGRKFVVSLQILK